MVGVPAADDLFAYISCGTWSLVGVETSGPVRTEAARAVFGRRAAWAAAALTAVNPFLTYHSYEARMYALMALLSLLATGAFLQAFVLRRRIFVPVFGAPLRFIYAENLDPRPQDDFGRALLRRLGRVEVGDPVDVFGGSDTSAQDERTERE